MTLALFAVSCYDDKSTSGEITDTVEIDTTGFGPKIEIANGSTLRLSPKVSPANDPDLAYEWKITVTSNGNETTFSKLSEEKDLERVITQAPSQKPYSLVFTVTNKRTGVQYMQRYNVYVISRMGDGVLVADTRDGATSDISLVRNNMFRPVTPGIPNTSATPTPLRTDRKWKASCGSWSTAPSAIPPRHST